MKVSDYIVEYLINQGIEDVFGYPGGMVTHLMESLRKYGKYITAHTVCHEQGAAFAACGYGQVSGKPGIAYATSGPGATNLLTGICNAYFDSIPTIFLTGQVNTFESKGTLGIRQRGFQETDIITMAAGVTKYAAYVKNPERIKYYLDRAFEEAQSGRKGPVLLDIPMDIFKSEIDRDKLTGYQDGGKDCSDGHKAPDLVERALAAAKRPCLLLGNGIKSSGCIELAEEVVDRLAIPVVSSMIAFDVAARSPYYFGFIGAYGHREANFIIAKSDLVICIGSRLDIRQVGAVRENFARDARIIRFDIDEEELVFRVHEEEDQLRMDVESALTVLKQLPVRKEYGDWLTVCGEIRRELKGYDERFPNHLIQEISRNIPEHTVITTDVGQNQVWVAQSFQLKKGQQVLFSGGLGAMGYSIPASIGACLAGGRRPVICFSGDGGFQMNIQELQFIAREQLPIKMIVLNNKSLGMIRHFQEMYFESHFFQTRADGGYTSPDFSRIGEAYGIRSRQIREMGELRDVSVFTDKQPFLLEVLLEEDTYVFPKLAYGRPNQDQEPLLDRETFRRIMEME